MPASGLTLEAGFLYKYFWLYDKISVTKPHSGTLIYEALCLALIFAGIKLFVYGPPDYGYTMSIFSDSPGKYQVRGTLTGSAAVISHYKVKATEDGGEELIVYSCLTSPLNRAGSFSIPCSVNGKYLDVNGTRIMADENFTPKMSLTAGSLSSRKQVILKSRRR